MSATKKFIIKIFASVGMTLPKRESPTIMKVGIITKTNTKGQIVIPKEYREDLGIKPDVVLNVVKRNIGIFIYPIKEIIGNFESENLYCNILKKTKGKWQEDWSKLRLFFNLNTKAR